jgi:cytoskeletal protein CcmA (bactofilin family)
MFGEKERSLKLIDDQPMTLLNQDAQFEGKLTFEGKVQINGKFRGEIFSEGTLIIGEGAEIDAQIDIDTIIIQGRVNGTIQAKTRIEMHPPAVVKGDIASPSLVISDGAFFEGSCSMGRDKGQVFDLPRKAVMAPPASQPEIQEEFDIEIAAEPAQEVDSLF